MLTDQELTDLRADVLELLPETVSVRRATITNDKGDVSESWAAVDSVSGRIDPMVRTDADGMVAEREAMRTYYRLSVEWDTNIQNGDQVIIASITYDVIELHKDPSKRAVKRAVVAVVN